MIALLIGCIPIVESGADAPVTSWVSKERAISMIERENDRLHDEMHRDRPPVAAPPLFAHVDKRASHGVTTIFRSAMNSEKQRC
ncbi:hypothetical protein [Burkholderia contaminans]|uniref:hypothetical protein n=1 Tax=Burkholderia contaminans TaxID=488447 RepID=UPI0015821204|nr:hypothetical protein [Burkholderia contaminans]